MEEWRDIAEFPGYQVSDLGRVRNADGLIMKPSQNRDGYKQIVLSNKGYRATRLISRLVAVAFIPNPNKESEADHINSIRIDNRACNIQWLSKSKNCLKRKDKPNKSGYKNIKFRDTKSPWSVSICRNQKYIFIKSYLTLGEAIAGRDEFLASLSN